MLLRRKEKESCDVLVIGSGGAGLRTAIAARFRNTDVLLVSKTKIGSNSNTYMSKAVISATGWGASDDDENTHIADTVRGGRFLNDQSMVARMAQRAHSEIAFLKGCGVNFDMDAGKLRLIQLAGHRFSRHVYGVNWCGSDLVWPLKRRAMETGVRLAERVFVTRLVAHEDRISGATGITANGNFVTIQAKVVVLATGGYAQIYLNTNNAPGITGDGQAMAYDLGIPLKDMEFVQFYPTAGGKRGNIQIFYEKVLSQTGVVLRNGQGKNILEHHGIADPTRVARDRLAQLIIQEIGQKAPPDQGVFIDMEALSKETARKLSTNLPSSWWRGKKVFQVTPTAHFCMGGIVTDHCGETPLKGLFAVGEVASGVHGANRLGGNALAEIFAMGSWVGEKAAERAVDVEANIAPESAFEEERSRLEGAYTSQGSRPKQLIDGLKRLMWHNVGVIRCESGLEKALKHLREPCPRVIVSSPADLIRLLVFQNMRCVAEMVCRAALERTESRGAHFRSDYPAENNRAWVKNIFLRKSGSGMSVESKSIGLDLVELEV